MKKEYEQYEHPITGEKNTSYGWGLKIGISASAFRVRVKRDIEEYGVVTKHAFRAKRAKRTQKEEKNSYNSFMGVSSSRTRALKSTGLHTVKLDIDTRRKYTRMTHQQKRDRFKKDPNIKPDLVALGLAVAPVAGQYITK